MHLHTFSSRPGCVVLELQAVSFPPPPPPSPPVPPVGGSELDLDPDLDLDPSDPLPDLLDLRDLISVMGVEGIADATGNVVVSIQVWDMKCGHPGVGTLQSPRLNRCKR